MTDSHHSDSLEDIAADPEQAGIARAVLDMVEAGPESDALPFDAIALDVFAYQYAHNEPYHEFCDASRATPETAGTWRDIPGYPTDAFKHDVIASFPMDAAVQGLMTSGTTSPNQRGRIFRDELGKRLVFAANRAMAGAYLFPDFERGERCRILIMAPSPQMAPSMGMAVGMEQTRQYFGTDDSLFLVGRSGVNVKALVKALRDAEKSGVPVAMIGATSAYVYFLRACERKKMRFCLPPGSRVCDGGGYRGRFGITTREDFYDLVGSVLGVPEYMCVNTLGLAETATNYFDDTLRNRVLGLPATPRRKVSPAWTRTQVVSAETGEVLGPEQVGLLRHYDVVNLPTVIGVQSDNLGVIDESGGFEIVGRAKVVDGKVAELPSEATVGPMGDRRIFKLLEAYVNFSIDFKMSRVKSSDEKADYLELRDAANAASGAADEGAASPSCPILVEDLVAGADDAEARARAERALGISEESSQGADAPAAASSDDGPPTENGGRE